MPDTSEELLQGSGAFGLVEDRRVAAIRHGDAHEIRLLRGHAIERVDGQDVRCSAADGQRRQRAQSTVHRPEIGGSDGLGGPYRLADHRVDVEGRLGGFFKDNCLLDQPAVADDKKSVGQLLDAAGVTVTRFVRFAAGA